MKKIFVIGKIGSGKSSFTKALNQICLEQHRKSQIVDLDKIGHEVRQSAQVQKALSTKFGFFATKTDLAKLIFKSPTNAETANKIMHPFIFENLCTYLKKLENFSCEIAIIEQTVYTGKNDKFAKIADILIYICTERDIREKRCIERGLNLQDFIARDKIQVNDDVYEKNADIIIDNNNDERSLFDQAKKILGGII